MILSDIERHLTYSVDRCHYIPKTNARPEQSLRMIEKSIDKVLALRHYFLYNY